tara:strand:+ start:1992 stop:2228 length:237 start_codon:yes stop_codon:yes gene_type:complete
MVITDKEWKAKKFLEKKGWQTFNLWHVEDVLERFNCSKDTAMEILIESMESESTMEVIHDNISIIAGEVHRLKEKTHE